MTLARSLIGQVGGPEVLAAALASAEGNPLFLEERLAEMLETGVLVRQRRHLVAARVGRAAASAGARTAGAVSP